MDVKELMESRYSCRKFADKAIDNKDILAILEAGRLAPSAINRQPWRFLVLEGDDLSSVDACTKCRYGAPVVILVCFDKDVSAKNPVVTPDYGWIDCGLAIMQMALMATSLGIGSCIVGAYDPDTARKTFNIPDNLVTYQFLMLGYPDAEPSPKHFERLPLEEIVTKHAY